MNPTNHHPSIIPSSSFHPFLPSIHLSILQAFPLSIFSTFCYRSILLSSSITRFIFLDFEGFLTVKLSNIFCPSGTEHYHSNPCPLGYVCPLGSSSPVPCPPPDYFANLSSAEHLEDCYQCPPDTVNHLAAQRACSSTAPQSLIQQAYYTKGREFFLITWPDQEQLLTLCVFVCMCAFLCNIIRAMCFGLSCHIS